jgi:hypothetical protein
LEDLGTTNVQILQLVSFTEPSLDVESFGCPWLAKLWKLPLVLSIAESVLHLFQDYHFTRRLWEGIAMWIGVSGLLPVNWVYGESVLEWWSNMVRVHYTNRKGLHFLIILISMLGSVEEKKGTIF